MEIERKFLVNSLQFKEKACGQRHIVQGYICSDAERSVRVRISDNEAFLTIKSGADAKGWSRYEFEKPISVSDAEELLQLCLPGLIDKTRYEVASGGHTWEVDVFHGENEGLIVAEIELDFEEEQFDLPSWTGAEVSGDARYYNAMLAKKTYSQWGNHDGS